MVRVMESLNSFANELCEKAVSLLLLCLGSLGNRNIEKREEIEDDERVHTSHD